MARTIVIVITILISYGIGARLVEAHVGTCIDLDRDGRVYFTDTLHNRIWRLDPDGRLTSLAQGMHLDFLIVGDDGNLYLVDDHAWRLTPQGGLTEVVRSTDVPKTLAWAFAVDDQGHIKGPQPRFGRVNAAAAGPDGSIYALDEEQRIRKIKPDGTVSILANSEEAAHAEGGEERRVRSMGLAVDAENNVYVANYWKRSVFKLSPDGRITTILSSRWPWVPVGVATAASDVYVVERMGNPYGPSGLFQVSTLEDRLGSPRIRKVSRNGTVTTLAVVRGERGLAVIIVPFTVIIIAIVIWRVRKKQLKRKAALGEVRS